MRFFENPANDTTVYAEHLQELREADSKVLRGCFSDKKYVYENIRVFDLWKEVKSLNWIYLWKKGKKLS